MRSFIVGLLTLLGLAMQAHACLWDSDTLAHEAQGIPDVVRVVTGRFERNPLLYYQMRLRRVVGQLQTDPANLALYDDAAVACDRLGHDDEAIAWMERKSAQLQRLNTGDAAVRDHQYRYLANVGTFWAHRWLRAGADRARIEEMIKARDYIANAIKLNPNAHFGRERYQLRAMDWIISPPKLDKEANYLPNFISDGPIDGYAPQWQGVDAERGLCGLIVLGGAWESVDVFNALAVAIEGDHYRSKAAYLAKLRGMELVSQGRRSLLPGAPHGKKLLQLLNPEWDGRVNGGARQETALQFHALRAEADAWQAQRTAYMMDRLRVGRHPDTDSTFWNEYSESAPPVISEPSPSSPYLEPLILGATAVLVILGAFQMRRRALRCA